MLNPMRRKDTIALHMRRDGLIRKFGHPITRIIIGRQTLIAVTETTLVGLINLFASQGYARCADGAYIDGIEKVAIYTLASGRPTHAARRELVATSMGK